jgi:Phage tail protein (Tail_P2_I)
VIPVLGTVGTTVYAELEPVQFAEADLDYPLAKFCQALGMQSDEIADIAADWTQLLDIDRVPSKALGWLAQFVGVRLRVGLSDAAQRDRIRNTDGWDRGKVSALVGAAQQYLTGAKTVIVRERLTSAYTFQIITRTVETPDSAAVLAALLEQKPGGDIMTYTVLSGADYEILKNGHALYSNVFADFATYQGVLNNAPGT